MLRIKLVRSLVGHNWRNREVARALGLTRPNKFVYRQDIPSVRGAIFKIKELVEVTVVADADVPAKLGPTPKRAAAPAGEAAPAPKKAKKEAAPAAEATATEDKPKRARKPKATEEGQE